MSRPRSVQHKGLPQRWTLKNGAYYYQVPPGLEHLWDNKKWFRLGDKLNEAYAVWAERTKQSETTIRTIGQLLDRYALEVIPTKAAASRDSNQNQLKMLRRVFADTPILPLKPQVIYQYVTRRSVKHTDPKTGRITGGRLAAHREIELLSHAYTKAVEWGVIDRHPFKGEVRLEGEQPRDRYVEDWEIVEALSLESRRKKGSVLMIQAYLRLKLLTGMSQRDLLMLTESQIKEDGLHIQRSKTKAKTGKRTIYAWSPELKTAVALAKSARPVISPFLFCNKKGECYVNLETGKALGWKSMWQRFMARVVDETKVSEHFTEHDLRAKVASDADSLEHARALLSHADSRTTNRVYRRKAEVVKPLK